MASRSAGGSGDSLVGNGSCVAAPHDVWEKDVTLLGSFVLVALSFGLLTSLLKSKWSHNSVVKALPATLIVFLLGGAFGLVEFALRNREHPIKLGIVSWSVQGWLTLDPNVTLFIFLPPLLFVSALQIDWHVMRRLMIQTMLLAGPGVVINVALTAVVALYCFGYDWGWSEAFLLGAMFGATDPVATVTLLKELGAPETLSVLIEGESLLNDGSGFMIFVVCFQLASGAANYTLTDIIVKVLIAAAGGTLIGALFGFFGLMVLQQAWEDDILAICTTVVVVFGSFFLSQMFDVSGVVAVVFLGLVFSAFSDGYIQHEVKSKLVRFWQTIEYMLNTLLFFFAGLAVVTVILRSDSGTYTIDARDWANLVILYVAINVIRWIGIVLLLPCLIPTGYGMSFKNHLVASYAGLRGAVGLIAALLVSQLCTCGDGEIPGVDKVVCLTHSTQSRMVFHMAGIVLLTLLINGTTTKFLVQRLGLDKQSAAARAFFSDATVNLQQHMDYVVESLRRHPYYKNADWDRVWECVPVLSREAYDVRKRKGLGHNRDSMRLLKELDQAAAVRFAKTGKIGDVEDSLSSPARVRGSSFDEQPRVHAGKERICAPEELLSETRRRFLSLVKANYREQFREGANQSWPAVQVLIEACNRCADDCDQELNEWSGHVAKYCQRPPILSSLSRPLYICLQSARDAHLADAYNVASTFVRAHKSVVPALVHLFSEDPQSSAMTTVLQENDRMLRLAKAFTYAVEHEHPEVAERVKTDIAAQRLLNEMGSFAHTMLERAEIEEGDMAQIESALENSRKDLHSLRRNGRARHQKGAVLRNSSLMRHVEREVINTIQASAKQVAFAQGAQLWRAGDGEARHAIVILKGRVRVIHSSGGETEKNVGDAIGAIDWVTKQQRFCTVECLTAVEALEIPFSEMHAAASRSSNLTYNLLREAGLVVLDSLYPDFQYASFNMLKSVLPHLHVLTGVSATTDRHDGSVMMASHMRGHTVFEVSKPVRFNGGIVIGLRGTITQLGNERATTVVANLLAHRPEGPIGLSDGAVLMHINATAVKNIEDFIKFAHQHESSFGELSEKGRRSSSKKKPSGKPQRTEALEFDDNAEGSLNEKDHAKSL